jgi:hypothetical protein
MGNPPALRPPDIAFNCPFIGWLSFKVMTWNVEDLFRPGAPSRPMTQAIYDEKLDGLAGLIMGRLRGALISRHAASL